jgi:phage FluMu gp28-like protein
MMDYIYHFHNQLSIKINDYHSNIIEETKTSIILNNGGEIHSLPNSANTIRGFKADDIYIDEFAHFTNNTDKEILEAITPSITRGGRIYYISTPFGDQNIFYNFWHNNDNLEKIIINYKDCPDFKDKDIESVKQQIGEDSFQQEFNNQFLSDMEGQEFPTQLITGCINPELEYRELNKKDEYIIGADIGREQDLTACVILQKNIDGYVLVHKHLMRQTPYSSQLDYFNYLLNNFNIKSFTIDETGIGNMIAEELSKNHAVMPITFNNENKQEMVGNLKKIMQNKMIQLVDDPQLVNSIRSIRRVYTPSNYLRFESGRSEETGHADVFWALALAVKENLTDFYFKLG